MSRGFQSDPIKEHAWLLELTHEVSAWRNAEDRAAEALRRAMADGVRSQVIADHLGVSRATLYRWIKPR